jgi:hypothetical protein
MLFLRKIYIYRAPESGEKSTPEPQESQPTLARATTAPNLTGDDSGLLLRRKANRASTTGGLCAADATKTPLTINIPNKSSVLEANTPSPSPEVRSADNLPPPPEVGPANNTKDNGGR